MSSTKPEDGTPKFRKATLKESLTIAELLKANTITANGRCEYTNGFSDEAIALKATDPETENKTGFRLSPRSVAKVRIELGYGSLVRPDYPRVVDLEMRVDAELKRLSARVQNIAECVTMLCGKLGEGDPAL